jgi:hypothetical protein
MAKADSGRIAIKGRYAFKVEQVANKNSHNNLAEFLFMAQIRAQ